MLLFNQVNMIYWVKLGKSGKYETIGPILEHCSNSMPSNVYDLILRRLFEGSVLAHESNISVCSKTDHCTHQAGQMIYEKCTC